MWCSWLLLFTVELGAVANEGDEVFHPSRHGQKYYKIPPVDGLTPAQVGLITTLYPMESELYYSC